MDTEAILWQIEEWMKGLLREGKGEEKEKRLEDNVRKNSRIFRLGGQQHAWKEGDSYRKVLEKKKWSVGLRKCKNYPSLLISLLLLLPPLTLLPFLCPLSCSVILSEIKMKTRTEKDKWKNQLSYKNPIPHGHTILRPFSTNICTPKGAHTHTYIYILYHMYSYICNICTLVLISILHMYSS